MAEQERVTNEVMGNLSKYAPGDWPARPAVLTWDDGQIVNAYKARESGRGKKEEQTQLGFFGAWRGAVLKVESENSGKLQVLLRVACYLEYAERWDQLEQLQEFVRDRYLLPLPRVDIPQNATWQAKTAERYSENRALLPIWLRSMTRPPPGYETAGATKDEPKKEPKLQASLSFVPEDP